MAGLPAVIALLSSPVPEGDSSAQTARPPEITIELCVDSDGTATPTWTDGIAIALGRETAEALESERRPLSDAGRAWLDVLREALPAIRMRGAELAVLFDVPAIDAVVAVGNRGSNDGFGWVDRHVGINVEAFHETYGAPDEQATDRMTRIVTHEYLHLLTYAFYPDHLERRTTPLDRALWTMFFEGIGDYVSISSRWRPTEDGSYSPVTAEALARLEPVFVDRLEALATADTEVEAELRSGISMGKFDEKWGSLPVALWLHSEVKREGEREVLRSFLRLERHGVLPLALRHAAPGLRDRLRALLELTARP